MLNGFGVNPCKLHNAVLEANTPNLDKYFSRYPHTLLQASGTAVGLPDGQMGNSEVGHLTLGCGSILAQDIVQINKAIDNGSFYENETLLHAAQTARQNNRPLHLLGLVSDGGVHSSLDHLLALIRLSKKQRVKSLLHWRAVRGMDAAPEHSLGYKNGRPLTASSTIAPALFYLSPSMGSCPPRHLCIHALRIYSVPGKAKLKVAYLCSKCFLCGNFRHFVFITAYFEYN